jgi:hypothetical protein
MISDIWTLEPNGSPGSAATLSALGFSGATLTRQANTAATLTLSMDRGDALTADLSTWTWASAWVLRRSGAVIFRGYLSRVPDLDESAASGSVVMEFKDVLWRLDRTDYTQEWTHAAGASLQAVRTARARLAWDPGTGERGTTKEALAAVMDAAAAAGVVVGLSTSEMPDLTPPPIEGVGKKCGELIRDLLRWHPDCLARIVSTQQGDTLTVTARDSATVRTIALGDSSLGRVALRRRDDLVVSSVHVSYEAEIPRSAEIPGEEETDPTVIRTRQRLAIFRDVYPPGSPLDWRSLSVVVPVPSGERPSGSGGGSQPHSVPIKTRPLPPTGAYNEEAEKFYLKQLGLEALGLTTASVKLPTSTVGTVLAHTVTFAHPADDPADPLYEVPSAINPASTPLWRPPSVGDLPRYLVTGTIAEWMRVEVAEVRCRATVAVSKAAVDALSPRNRAIFMERRPREGTVQGVAAYLIEADVVVRGTTAKTKVYTNWVAGGSGNVGADNSAAAAAAQEQVVIPDLAMRLWLPRSVAPWEGAVSLTEEEAGGTSYLGTVVRLSHASRPDWATMRASVQGETLTLATGETALQMGLPEHLEPSDFIALATPVREAAKAATAAVPVSPTSAEETGEDEEDARLGGVYPGTIEPIARAEARGLGSGELWGLEVTDPEAGTVRVRTGSIIKEDSDLSAELAIVGKDSTFTPSAGHLLRLKLTGPFDEPVATLESGAAWTGHPAAVQLSGEGGEAAFAAYYYPLWEFSASGSADAVLVKPGLFARRLAPPTHFLRTASTYASPGNRPIARPLLLPYHAPIS